MATRRKKRRKTPARGKRGATPGWLLLGIGLAFGVVAVLSYNFVSERLAKTSAGSGEAPASITTPAAPSPAPASQEKASSGQRFEFYDMLPNSEVLIPGEDQDVRRDTTRAPVGIPGTYVLQAGAFGNFADADRVKAQLALLGISSQIQKITVDERQFHRVRIGPIDDLDELNRTRQRLRDARLDVLVIRVGE